MSTEYFGYISAFFITISFVPYFLGIIRGETKPERASWFIWSVLGGISFFSQVAKGATDSLWLPAIQGVGDILFFVCSFKYGIGGFLKRDKIALVGAGLSLILWYLTREAAVALFLAIFIDGLGAVLTMIKSYEHPSTEPIISWLLTALGGLFTILAVGNFNWILLAFPIYIFLINLLITGSILLGRYAQRTT